MVTLLITPLIATHEPPSTLVNVQNPPFLRVSSLTAVVVLTFCCC